MSTDRKFPKKVKRHGAAPHCRCGHSVDDHFKIGCLADTEDGRDICPCVNWVRIPPEHRMRAQEKLPDDGKAMMNRSPEGGRAERQQCKIPKK